MTFLIRLLDHAAKAVPAARYFWGVVAASVTVAFISLLNGLNRLTFVAILAALGAMFVFYIFSRFEKASDPVVKLLGYVLLIVATLAFVFIIATSAWLALTCTPRLMAYVYGIAEVCYGPASPPETTSAKQPPTVPLTFENLFEGAFPDLGNYEKRFPLQVKDTATNGEGTIEVRFRVYPDFRSHTEFISIYIPQVSNIQAIISDIRDQIILLQQQMQHDIILGQDQPGVPYTDSAALHFSGRVFVFTLSPLGAVQIGGLTKWYEEKDLHLEIRGMDYWRFYRSNAQWRGQ